MKKSPGKRGTAGSPWRHYDKPRRPSPVVEEERRGFCFYDLHSVTGITGNPHCFAVGYFPGKMICVGLINWGIVTVHLPLENL